MDKDDSTGTSFEIVDKKAIEQASNGDKSGKNVACYNWVTILKMLFYYIRHIK